MAAVGDLIFFTLKNTRKLLPNSQVVIQAQQFLGLQDSEYFHAGIVTSVDSQGRPKTMFGARGGHFQKVKYDDIAAYAEDCASYHQVSDLSVLGALTVSLRELLPVKPDLLNEIIKKRIYNFTTTYIDKPYSTQNCFSALLNMPMASSEGAFMCSQLATAYLKALAVDIIGTANGQEDICSPVDRERLQKVLDAIEKMTPSLTLPAELLGTLQTLSPGVSHEENWATLARPLNRQEATRWTSEKITGVSRAHHDLIDEAKKALLKDCQEYKKRVDNFRMKNAHQKGYEAVEALERVLKNPYSSDDDIKKAISNSGVGNRVFKNQMRDEYLIFSIKRLLKAFNGKVMFPSAHEEGGDNNTTTSQSSRASTPRSSIQFFHQTPTQPSNSPSTSPLR